jgi:ribosome-associated toxin RatA of RatAB toxin-antitoxin module
LANSEAREFVPPIEPFGTSFGPFTVIVFMFAQTIIVVALALFVAATPSASAATITVDAERRGDAIDIHATAVLNADAATAWQVLTDYNRYTEFIPDLRSSRIVSRVGATVTVEQSGDAALWQLRIPIAITFEIIESPPDKLRSRAVAGSLRTLASSYALTPTTDGVRLDYVGHIAPGWEIFGQIEQAVVEQNIARQFQALADEIERAGAASRGPHSVGGPRPTRRGQVQSHG